MNRRLPANPRKLGLRDGFGAPFQAAIFLFRHPRLLRYVAIPVAINLVLLPLVFWAIWHFGSGWLFGRFAEADHAWWADTLIFLAKTLLFLATGVVSGLVFVALSLVLSAPFHGWLSERVEEIVLAGRPELVCIPQRTAWRDATISVSEALKRGALALLLLAGGLALNLLPLVGSLLAFVFNGGCVVLLLALDSFNYPLERREIPVRERVRWVLRNFAYALGFGLPFCLVPCALFVVPPLSAVAATREFSRLLLEQERDAAQ